MRYGDYDATGFRVEQDTAENLMLKNVCDFMFLKKFEEFLQRSVTEPQSAAVDFSERLSAISLTISDLEDCYASRWTMIVCK